jgi:hypothetical protein
MPSSTARTFTDPDAYRAGIRPQRLEVVVTARGDFRAEVTRVDFARLSMQRADEKLPRVLSFAPPAERVAIIFPTSQRQPATHVNGMELSRTEMIRVDPISSYHRSAAACQWGSMSLTQEDLAAAGYTIIGRELTPPSCAYRLRPPAPVLSRLLSLHEAAGHLAKSAPDILAKPEVAQAMEQALVEAMVLCLAGGDPIDLRSVHRHHATLMSRLEAVLQADSEGPLYMSELCTAVGASYPTLRPAARSASA